MPRAFVSPAWFGPENGKQLLDAQPRESASDVRRVPISGGQGGPGIGNLAHILPISTAEFVRRKSASDGRRLPIFVLGVIALAYLGCGNCAVEIGARYHPKNKDRQATAVACRSRLRKLCVGDRQKTGVACLAQLRNLCRTKDRQATDIACLSRA